MSHQVSFSLLHVETWKTLKWCELTRAEMDLTFMENWSIFTQCVNLQLISAVRTGWWSRCVSQRCFGLCLIVIFLFVFSFWGFSGEGPRLAVVTREDSCYCVDEFEILQLQCDKQTPEARWDEEFGWALEWDGVSVGSTLSGPDCQSQREATNDSMVAGSSSRTLVCVSRSTLSSLFFLCLTVCEKYVPRGLVGAVKWWLSVWVLVEAQEAEEGQLRKDSNCVYGSNTIISPCDSLIEWLLKGEWGLCVWPLTLLHCNVSSLLCCCRRLFVFLSACNDSLKEHSTKHLVP